MLRRIVRWMAWGVKGVLAVVAVAALVLWPWSYRRAERVTADRLNASDQWVDLQRIGGAWERGRVGIGWASAGFRGSELESMRALAKEVGPGWKWTRHPLQPSVKFSEAPNSWGPLHWGYADLTDADGTASERYFSLPLYLLALLAGAWPLASAALLIRRRRRARRLASAKCCRQCGYDLRSTPDASGPLLATCPECGAAAESPAAA
jgi:hypothetical protein